MAVLGWSGLTNLTPSDAVIADFTALAREVTRKTADIARKEAVDNAREFRDTGALTDSINATVSDLSAEVFTDIPYAAAVEEGRQAGARRPPVEALEDWASRRGIDEFNIYVVARAIGRGIPGRFYMKRAADSVDQQFETVAREVIARELGT